MGLEGRESGKKNLPKGINFRRITLLSVVGDLFESIIAARINPVLKKNDVVDDRKGFVQDEEHHECFTNFSVIPDKLNHKKEKLSE